MDSVEDEQTTLWDVVICGAGMAGLTLALQVRQESPDLTVALLDKLESPLPDAAHKIGESSVELGSQYLERLGLYEYLQANHIIKFGLRFFAGGGELPLHKRLEVGPNHEPIIRSWQVDRGRFETDLRVMVKEAGVHLIEGATIKDIVLNSGDTDHVVSYTKDETVQTLGARWLADATGRAGFLRRRLKSKRGAKHPAHGSWFRVKGRVDISKFVPEGTPDTDWHERTMCDQRWRSTAHMMGTGYWVWIIPLASGNTSIGVVVHDESHDFDNVRTLESTRAFIAKHEVALGENLVDAEVMDFGAIKNYAHVAARSWSPDRWALVGEAGSFTDPLYSPGTDLIAFANSFTSTLIAEDAAGDVDMLNRTRELNLMYRALISGGLKVYRGNAPIYGHPRAMSAKIYFDNFCYWSFPCQYFQQSLYKLRGDEHTKFAWAGSRFVDLSGYSQALWREWAQLAPEAPTPGFQGIPSYPSVLIDAHCALQNEHTPAEALVELMKAAGQADVLLAEMVIRLVQEVGPEVAGPMLKRLEVVKWGLSFTQERMDCDTLTGVARRRALPPLARDVERGLGAVRRHPQAAEARALLLEVATGKEQAA